jgi:hypothetical protein
MPLAMNSCACARAFVCVEEASVLLRDLEAFHSPVRDRLGANTFLQI